MTNQTTQLSIQELYARVGQLLKRDINLFRGLTINGVSIDKKLEEHPTFPSIYCNGTSSLINGNKEAKYSINLKIPNATITALKNENPLASESGTKYDIIIDDINVSPSGQITVTVMSIKETGLSDRELLNRRLTAYCEQKGYLGVQKRHLPRFVRSVAAITSDSSTILDDILSNLNLQPHKIRIHKCKTSDEIAEAISSNNDLDITVLFRGGREDEHMAIFSSERIIDAIMQSKVPVCIALGHEVDRPFIYTVGDHDYSTPSAFAKSIAELNQLAINDQASLFLKVKERLIDIKNASLNFVSLRQERVENLCKQIVIAKIKGIEIAEKKVGGYIDSVKVKAISAIELKKKNIDLVINEIVYTQKNFIDKSLNNIEWLSSELIEKEKAKQKAETIQKKVNEDKKNIIIVFGIILIVLISYIIYLLSNNG